MILNLNGSSFYSLRSTQRLLIYSGKLPGALDLVSFCLLQVGGRAQAYPYRNLFYNTVAADSQYDHSDNCCDKDVSFSYKYLLFRNVRLSTLLFPGQR
jgi:hypothetical protein